MQQACDIRSYRRHPGGQGIGHQLCLSRRGLIALLGDERARTAARFSLGIHRIPSLYCPEIELYLSHLPYTSGGPLHNRMRALGIKTKNSPIGWHPGLSLNLLRFQKGSTKKINKVQIWVRYILGKRRGPGGGGVWRRSLI